jgi:RNA polymerase sigma factor (sigma-70 family)
MRQDDDRAYDCLDMALVDDEALIVLANECDYSPARDEILLRYSPQTERLIQWLARSTQFGSTDIEDARQNAVFWTVEAISKFDTLQADRARRCSFYSFLYRVLVARFKDFSKQVRRLERRRRLASDGPGEEDSSSHLFRDPTDPAMIAETQEAIQRLQAAVAELDEESQQIWQRLCEGNSLRETAAQLGLSYDAAKRRRRKLIATLKLHLRQVPSGSTVRSPDAGEANGG